MRPKGPRDPVAGLESGPEPPFPIKLSGPVIKGFGRGSRELGIPTANIPPAGLAQYPDLQSGVYYGFVALRLHPDTTQAADNSMLTLSSSASSLTTTDAGSGSARGQPIPEKGNDATSPETISHGSNGTAGGEGRGKDGVEDANRRPDCETTSVYPAVLSIGYNLYYKNETRSIEVHVLHPFPRFNFYHSPLNLLILGFIRPEYDYESLDALVDDIKTDCDVARKSLDRPAYQPYQGDAWLKRFDWVRDVDVKAVEEEVTGKGATKGEGTTGAEEEKSDGGKL